jgi:hypothetical protein
MTQLRLISRHFIFRAMLVALSALAPPFAVAQASGPTLEQRLPRVEDELIREDGQWKILRHVDYPVMPTSEEWMKFIRERRAGAK